MRVNRKISGRNGERGIVILLVAVFLLFVVGAMAVLAIDFVTFYTARSEARLAAEDAALAGARVMANSGATSNPVALSAFAHPLATSTATLVATQNKVGGRNVNPAEVNVNFPASPGVGYNPRVRVTVARNDLPTFFARIWGSTQVTVGATATAEAYNPSGVNISLGTGGPIAPTCVKPWLLPNLDPGTGSAIFASNGTIVDNSRLGETWLIAARCKDCSPGGGGILATTAGKYYPGAIDPDDFPVPTQSLQVGTAGFNDYQLAVAGCVQKPIVCGAPPDSSINIDTNAYGTDRDADTVEAVNLLIHYKGAAGNTDSIDTVPTPNPPFQFVGGNANPVAGAVGHSIMVSDSLVTVPIFNSGPAGSTVTSPVQVIGFLQLFINPQGNLFPQTGNAMEAKIINMAGCGVAATGQPVLGTGASAIPVRLISNP